MSSSNKRRYGRSGCIAVVMSGLIAMGNAATALAATTESLMYDDIESVVTATKTKQKITEVPASATVITDEQIRHMGATTLADVLRTVPGVYISASERHLKRIHIRGIGNSISSYNDKVLLLVDGTPIKDPVYGHAFIDEYLPVENIKRVEVIKGPASALYGTNAFAGVINVITKDASDVNGAEVTAGYGTKDTATGSVLAGGKAGPVSVTAFGRGYTTNGDGQEYSKWSDKNRLEQDPVKANSFGLKAAAGGLSFNAQYLQYEHKFPTNPDTNEREWDTNWFYYDDLLTDMKYESDLTEYLHNTTKLWYQSFDHHNYYEGSIRNAGYAAVRPVKTSEVIGAQTDFSLSLFKQHDIIVGAEYDYLNLKEVNDKATIIASPRNGFRLGDEVLPRTWFMDPVIQRNWALYAQDIYRPLDWLDITLGARQDEHNDFGSSFSPRGGVVMRPADNQSVKVLYGEAYRAPSPRDLYVYTTRFSASGVPTTARDSSPDLKPEHIKSAEVEYSYAFTRSLRGQANVYCNWVTDLITSAGSGDWVNAEGESKIKGLEGQVEYTFGDSRAFLNYSYNDAQDSRGDALPDIPQNMANLGLDYKALDNLFVTPTVTWVDSRLRRANDLNNDGGWWDDTRYPFGQKRPDIDGYFLVDLSATLQVWKVSMTASVYNLFDQRYYDAPETTPYRDVERAGRTAMVRATYKF